MINIYLSNNLYKLNKITSGKYLGIEPFMDWFYK